MTTLALGRRQLAAHPQHGNYALTCATFSPRAHVHFREDDRPHYFMPDACAACGRTWFADGEETFMGYCWDCMPGNTVLLDVTDGVEVVAATFLQPVQPARGRAKPVYPFPPEAFDAAYMPRVVNDARPGTRWADINNARARVDSLICPGCGHLADFGHGPLCPVTSR